MSCKNFFTSLTFCVQACILWGDFHSYLFFTSYPEHYSIPLQAFFSHVHYLENFPTTSLVILQPFQFESCIVCRISFLSWGSPYLEHYKTLQAFFFPCPLLAAGSCTQCCSCLVLQRMYIHLMYMLGLALKNFTLLIKPTTVQSVSRYFLSYFSIFPFRYQIFKSYFFCH